MGQSAPCHCSQHPRWSASKEEGLLWLTVLEVLVRGQWLWARGGTSWWEGVVEDSCSPHGHNLPRPPSLCSRHLPVVQWAGDQVFGTWTFGDTPDPCAARGGAGRPLWPPALRVKERTSLALEQGPLAGLWGAQCVADVPLQDQLGGLLVGGAGSGPLQAEPWLSS